MCGRYAAFLPAEAIRQLFATSNPTPNFAPSWNVAPTQDAPVVRRHPESGARHLDLLRWGLLPYWAKDRSIRQPINARAETVASAPMFRDAYARRRCLVPADLFYEWATGDRGAKQPVAIARDDGAQLALAGLWEGWRGPDAAVVRSFTIVTTQAAATIRHLHERMPVVVEPADWPLWLGESEGDPAALLAPSAAKLRSWAVSTRVNNARANDAGLIEPVAALSLPEPRAS